MAAVGHRSRVLASDPGGQPDLRLKGADLRTSLAFIGLAACALALAPDARAESVSGIASVVSGGTVQVGGELIRLIDIDVPGREHFCIQAVGDAAWRCGEQATVALLNLVGSAVVTCHGETFDQFGRRLGRCTVGGRDLAVALAEGGWAIPRDDCECQEVRAAALRAQANRLGIWTDPFTLPWERSAVYYLGDAQY
jgi:endonuclease YncB( thermonuclease family)